MRNNTNKSNNYGYENYKEKSYLSERCKTNLNPSLMACAHKQNLPNFTLLHR